MMKFPSVFAGGIVPSGNSVAATYPAVCGSRVGGAGREVAGASVAARRPAGTNSTIPRTILESFVTGQVNYISTGHIRQRLPGLTMTLSRLFTMPGVNFGIGQM